MKTTLSYLVLALVFLCSNNMDAKAASSSTETIKNLQEAFIGESTASAKYAAFAKKAKEEGLAKIGLMFEAASKAEAIHAGNHKAVLEQFGGTVPKPDIKFDVKSTKENLQSAIEGESYEIATMYPGFLKTAQKENISLAMVSFNYAYQTEKKHKELYANALKALNSGSTDQLSSVYAVCTVCGNTYDTKEPQRCGLCMTPEERFVQFKL